MLAKMNQMVIATFLSVTGCAKGVVEDLKSDERGLSGVVVAVLLILVAVLAVVMLWGFLSGWLGEIWERITGAADTAAYNAICCYSTCDGTE